MLQRSANSPFNVGVSGHRDLNPDDLARLRAAVVDFLNRLKALLPDTDLQIIVGMAEGADLLVAQAALDSGLPVQAVLPMPLAQYIDTFDPPNLELLKSLLAHAKVRCMELSPPRRLVDEHRAAEDPSRDALYENLTRTLIRRSSLLLALWDGNASHLPGGTADTVLRYLEVRKDTAREDIDISFVDASSDLEATERLVYWIPAPRVSTALAPQASKPCFLRGVGDYALELHWDMPAALAQQLGALNHYNREYQELVTAGRIDHLDSLLATLPADTPMSNAMLLEVIDTQYGKADALAVRYQWRSDRLFVLFGLMTFAMGVALLAYENITGSRLLLFGYTCLLLTSITVYYVLRGRNWFAKHLTYRAIAETMRAKFYLRLAGIDQRVDAAEVLGMWGIDRFHGFGWIGYVLKGVESPDIHSSLSREDEARRSQLVEQTWIENQHRYFSMKVAKLENSARRIKRLSNFLFVVILVVMVSLFFFGESMPKSGLGFGVPMKNVLTFLMESLVVLLGVWKLHRDKMATRELLWQYRNQLSHFSRARRQLARISSQRRRNEVLAELGKDSLMESYLWTIHRYHREHEPPATG